MLSTSYPHKPAQRAVWRHSWVRWLQNLLGKLGGGSESSVGSGVVASVKEVYELYLHILMTLGILWQLCTQNSSAWDQARAHWNVCAGARGGGCGGTLHKWPESAGKLGRKSTENCLINKMVWSWIAASRWIKIIKSIGIDLYISHK